MCRKNWCPRVLTAVVLTPEDLERLLRTGRPRPQPDFTRALERKLIPERPRRERRQLRVLIASVGLAFALGAMVIALGAAGLLPIQIGGGSRAQAERDCGMVMVERRERIPSFERDRNGEPVVRYHTETVQRPVRRCR
jgi:hypothetical protein